MFLPRDRNNINICTRDKNRIDFIFILIEYIRVFGTYVHGTKRNI